MPDPLQPTTTSTPPEPSAPVLPNPQDMVDAALSTDITTAKTETVIEPKVEPSSLPPLAPLAPTPELVTSTPDPTVPPVIAPTPVAMGDDTPLAFAGMTAPTTAATETTSISTTQPVTPPPTSESTSLPPIVPQAPEPKKKGKLGKILAGIAVLVLVLAGGIFGYNQYAQTGMVALVGNCRYVGSELICTTPPPTKTPTPTPKPTSGGGGGTCSAGQKKCSGSTLQICTGGGNWTNTACQYGCENGACKADPATPTRCNNGAKQTGACQTTTKTSTGADRICKGTKVTSICQNGSWVSTHAGDEACEINQSTCVVTGSGGEDEGDACTIGGKTGFRHGGVCVPTVACSPTDLNGQGCPTACTAANVGWTPVQEPGGGSYCNAQGQQCSRYRKELKNPTGNQHCFIGYGETCGGSCGDNNTPPPSAPPGTPVLACTGLTSVPATTTPPVIGTKLTFTCAGTVTPTSAGTPSYKFRYSINNGTYSDLIPLTATPNKVELTINACGSYKVQCQACATIAGVLKCDPVWTGVTQ
jgi:hypothetical protein